ncbi:DUF2780 domain-containing protein [Pseudomonas sp. SCB32]|uniref:DUF2780 domain-containing protein n=1 Tax=Pseudomonas sp. SCB32 TaxID=2653853 RepID=UPI001263EA11|nr:DUF2780 domain-containing protein [Pseudomonas sp. SCB32]
MFAKSAAVLAAAWLAVSPVFAATFTETAEPAPSAEAPAQTANALLSNLTRQLGVSEQQAIGGTGALLGLALNTLKENDSTQLQKAMPNMQQLSGNESMGDLGGVLGGLGGAAALLGGINNLQDVDQIFGVLGMDQSMIGRFAGVILDYFTEQGLSSQLLGTLGGLWGMPASPALKVPPVTGRGV